jgi:hypothetical protein
VNGEEQSDQYVQAETKNRHDSSQVANYFLWAPGPLTYWIDSLLAEGEYVYWARLYIRMHGLGRPIDMGSAESQLRLPILRGL